MKKLLLTLTSIATLTFAFGQQGQIQNGGFENWTTTVVADTLSDWNDSNREAGPITVFKSTDASDALYAAEISAALAGPNQQDTTFGYIFHGTVGNNGPEAGISYTADFDEVQYMYKANLEVNDTLYLLVLRLNSGIPLGVELYPAAFGQVNTWTQGSINVSNATQNELFIGFVLGDPFDNFEPSPNSSAKVDDVRMFNGGAGTTDLPDPSLENWSSVSVENPDNWYTLNEIITRIGLSENVQKTTDAATGTYAAEISVLYEPQNQDTIGGVVSLGPIDNIGGGNPFIPTPYDAMPTQLTGSYKYAPANMDSNAGLLVEFYNSGSIIGSQYQPFTSKSTYTNFTLSINLMSAPDSIIMYAFAGENPGSVLHLDDLSFNGGDVGLAEENAFETIVYPNPANEFIHLRADAKTKYKLIDVMGNLLNSGVTESSISEFDISSLQQGVYFFNLTRDEVSTTIKFIKK